MLNLLGVAGCSAALQLVELIRSDIGGNLHCLLSVSNRLHGSTSAFLQLQQIATLGSDWQPLAVIQKHPLQHVGQRQVRQDIGAQRIGFQCLLQGLLLLPGCLQALFQRLVGIGAVVRCALQAFSRLPGVVQLNIELVCFGLELIAQLVVLMLFALNVAELLLQLCLIKTIPDFGRAFTVQFQRVFTLLLQACTYITLHRIIGANGSRPGIGFDLCQLQCPQCFRSFG